MQSTLSGDYATRASNTLAQLSACINARRARADVNAISYKYNKCNGAKKDLVSRTRQAFSPPPGHGKLFFA